MILAAFASTLAWQAQLNAAVNTPQLTRETNGTTLILTWTNDPTIHLLEATNEPSVLIWQISTRPAEYFGGWSQLAVTNDGAPGTRVQRLIGSSGAEPTLRIIRQGGTVKVRWPAEHEGFSLQHSVSEAWPYEWLYSGEPVTVEGYKRVRVPLEQASSQQFRLTSPINHILIVGQSLAIGAGGVPLLSTNQPYDNRMFARSAPVEGDYPEEDLTTLVPLVEQQWPGLTVGETIASGFANWTSWRRGTDKHDLLVSNCGRGGAPYVELKRGTEPYTQGTNQVAAAFALRQSLGYEFRAVFALHGEADAPNGAYDADIREWQRNLEEDIQQITGTTDAIPMFHSQMSYTRGLSQFGLLAEHERNPAATVLVCPKYFLPYIDGAHLNGHGYRWLGEYYAKAYEQHVLKGRAWSPVRPTTIERSNNVISLVMTGVVNQLVIDTNMVTNPARSAFLPIRQEGPLYFTLSGNTGTDRVTVPEHSLTAGDELLIFADPPPGGPTQSYQLYLVHSVIDNQTIRLSTNATAGPLVFNNAWNVTAFTPIRTTVGPYGFEYYDDAGGGVPWSCSTWVTAVDLEGTNSVRITLNRTPQGTNRRIRYAYSVRSATYGALGGPQTGPRGCLRDSDPTPSQYGYTLYNWCVHFDKPCP